MNFCFCFFFLLYYRFVIFEDVSCRSHAEQSRVWRCVIYVSKLTMMFWYLCLIHRLGVTSSLRLLCPTNSMLECPPFATLRQAMYFQSQCCCGVQLFAVYFESVRFLQNRCLGRISVCSLLFHSQRVNTDCSWMCDECN